MLGTRPRPSSLDVVFTRFLTPNMKNLLFRLLFRKKRFPWFFNEITKGNLKARIGQNISSGGELEVVIHFFRRDNFATWKKLGEFRYLDTPQVMEIYTDVEHYLRSLVVGN